jgi:hypothetical protein
MVKVEEVVPLLRLSFMLDQKFKNTQNGIVFTALIATVG